MYGHDGASNNVAPNRTIVFSEQHCCWPNHDHTLGVVGTLLVDHPWEEPKYAPTLQQSSN